MQRCLPALKRWAHGRLPPHGRALAETDDLVQVTLMRALNNVETFRPERQGSFLAYLRQILLNALKDEARRGSRTPRTVSIDDDPSRWRHLPSEADPASDIEALESYERALAVLPERQAQAIVLKLEFGMTYPEIAAELDFPSANAARMQVSRGLVRLSEVMPA